MTNRMMERSINLPLTLVADQCFDRDGVWAGKCLVVQALEPDDFACVAVLDQDDAPAGFFANLVGPWFGEIDGEGPSDGLLLVGDLILWRRKPDVYNTRQVRPSFWISRSASTGPHVPA